MKTKNTLSISEARRKFFSIADEVQDPDIYYTLTERGRPKIVVLSAEKFESISEEKARYLTDAILGGYKNSYGKEASTMLEKALVLRDEPFGKYLPQSKEYLRYKEVEYIKAVLYVKLIENYNYPPRLLSLNRYVRVDEGRRQYMEIDVTVIDESGGAKMIMEAMPFEDCGEKVDEVIRNLFHIADAVKWEGNLRWLVCYSYSAKNSQNKTKEKISVVDYDKYKSFLSWKKAGKPADDKIPSFKK